MFNGDYLSIFEGTGSCGYLFHEIPSSTAEPKDWVSFSTADFILKVLGVNTRSMETIYLFLRAHVALGTFFRKSPVYYTNITWPSSLSIAYLISCVKKKKKYK